MKNSTLITAILMTTGAGQSIGNARADAVNMMAITGDDPEAEVSLVVKSDSITPEELAKKWFGEWTENREASES